MVEVAGGPVGGGLAEVVEEGGEVGEVDGVVEVGVAGEGGGVMRRELGETGWPAMVVKGVVREEWSMRAWERFGVDVTRAPVACADWIVGRVELLVI